MLIIKILDTEVYDEGKDLFYPIKGKTLILEHSLVSLAKWESKWGKPFLSKKGLTRPETIDYIRCMTITQNIPPEVYRGITSAIIVKVNAYLEHPMTATTFSNRERKALNREIITAEIIYYWMVTLSIPFECQKWHLNRLLALINVCNIKNQPAKKMTRQEVLAKNRALNAQRRQRFNTKG